MSPLRLSLDDDLDPDLDEDEEDEDDEDRDNDKDEDDEDDDEDEEDGDEDEEEEETWQVGPRDRCPLISACDLTSPIEVSTLQPKLAHLRVGFYSAGSRRDGLLRS